MLKTDKQDALGLANHLYNQLELGVQLADKTHLVRRAVPPTEAAALLRGLIRHRYELTRESTRRKNKLIAICDELFPEFTQIFKDPTLPTALAVRERFPTPAAVGTALLAHSCAARMGTRPSTKHLQELQEAARASIGTHDLGRQRSLCIEQRQLIVEVRLLHQHIEELNAEITRIMERSREGRILLSMPGIGTIQGAAILAAIGHIDNFPQRGCPQGLLRLGTQSRAQWHHAGSRSSQPLRHAHDEADDIPHRGPRHPA